MTDKAPPPISIVMPSAGRPAVLAETLAALRADAPAGSELIVAVEGPGDDSASAATEAGATVVRVPESAGPGAARNAAIARAGSPLCLLCDDDVRPAPGMVGAHIAFHAAETDPMVALMGLVAPEPPLDRSEFQRWLHTDGIQFAYGQLTPGEIDGRCLWVANASFKRSGIDAIGGFDEAIGFGSEDADLGTRFVAAGGRIVYRDDVVGLHFKPTTLGGTLARMRRVGAASRDHPERLARETRPRPTGPAQRAAIGALSAVQAAGLLRGPLRRAAWRVLCKQAYREAYWRESTEDGVAVGSRLAGRLGEQIARTDPSAGPPSARAES